MKRLLLPIITFFILLSPGSINTYQKLLGVDLPIFNKYYSYSFKVIFLVLLVDLIYNTYIAFFKDRGYYLDPHLHSPIKGLLPFQKEDATIFHKLQRESIFKEIQSFITNRMYRLGIITGELGVGKTSFIQASLIPSLTQEDSGFQCVHIKLSNELIVNSVRTAFINQLNLTEEETANRDFMMLLNAAKEKYPGKVLIIILDEFEQFFVHKRSKEKRKPFIDFLVDWYKNYSEHPTKILISIRNDMLGYLYEIQTEMNYPLIANQNYFFLEKFTPEQAFQILKVIAEHEGLTFDESFVKEMTEKELPAREDGLISPVDIQIFSLMISEYKQEEGKAFTRNAYERFGGIEGLLSRYLREQLNSFRNINGNAIKILIALTDFERNARAGLKTLKTIKTKFRAPGFNYPIQSTLDWLEKTGLISVTQMNGEKVAYQLAHESLIPPLQKLAGSFIYHIERTSHIIEEKVNQWIGSNQSKKYLLTLNEYIKIVRYKPFLTWGTNKEQKDSFIIESEKRFLKIFAWCLGFIFLLSSPVLWWFTPYGQEWQMKKELFVSVLKIDDNNLIRKTSLYMYLLNEESKVRAIINALPQEILKSEYYMDIALASYKVNDRDLFILFLNSAVQDAESLESPVSKVESLIYISKKLYEVKEDKKASEIFLKCFSIVDTIDDPIMRTKFLSELFQLSFEHEKNLAETILQKEEESVTYIKDEYYQLIYYVNIINNYHLLDNTKIVADMLKKVDKVLKSIPDSAYKSNALNSISELLIRIAKDKHSESFFKDAIKRIKEIPISSDRDTAIKEFMISMIHYSTENKDKNLLSFLARNIEEVKNTSDLISCYLELSKAFLVFNDPKTALQYVSKSETKAQEIIIPEVLSGTYREIATTLSSSFSKKDKAYSILKNSNRVSNRIMNGYDKSISLRENAKLAFELGDKEKAKEFIASSVQIAKTIKEDSFKSSSLTDIAKITLQMEETNQTMELLKQAMEIANVIPYEAYRSSSLRYVAEVAAEFAERTNNDSFIKLSIMIGRNINTEVDKALCFRDISKISRSMNRKKEADNLLGESLHNAMQIPSAPSKDMTLKSLAAIYSTIHSPFQTRKIISQMEDPKLKVESILYFFTPQLEKKYPNVKLQFSKEEESEE